MDHPEKPGTLAIDTCDSEPIHRPGLIQPFGALLAGPLDLSRIDFASANTQDMLKVSAQAILGASFSDVLDDEAIHALRNMLSMPTSRTQRERIGHTEIGGRRIEIFAHRNNADMAIVELEPIDLFVDDRHASPIDRMRLILAQAAQQHTLDDFLQVCVHGLRSLTGYGRVKAYRYAENGDGEVVAESRTPEMESFLGLRYPAWDVPQQARALQIRCPLRMLSDVWQEPVDLLGHTQDPDTLDMSLAHLRGVSPVHIQYLKNMGVNATMSIGLIVDGKLWGMFACHHMAPLILRSDTRIAAELFGQMISLAIQQKLETRTTQARARAEMARRHILASTDAATDLLKSFPDLCPMLRSVVRSDGLAVVRSSEIQSDGSVPGIDAIQAIERRKFDDDNLIEGTDSLAANGWAAGNDIGVSAGCLQIRCAATAPLQIMFFRDEKTRNIRWAGKPEKDIQPDEAGWKLTPRASFSSYLEKQRHFAEPWTAEDMEAAKELQRLLMQITSKDERAQMQRHRDLVTYQRQQDLMIAELNHRVKNILALIRSLSRQAKASSASLESYAQALEQRIAALAAAHDLAVSNTMQGVSVRSILETELKPYLADDTMQVLVAGPVVGLRADVAPMIALVIHEIVTNAAKYGALSTDAGVVKVNWSVSGDGLSFTWREIGGPVVAPPTRHGFGQSLIEKAIPYEFDGTASLDFAAEGVSMSFTLPANTLVDMTEETDTRIVGKIGEIKKVANGKSALAVEDNIVLAMDMVESLSRLGAEPVETAGSVEDAMRLLGQGTYDVAVLDMNLRGTVSFEVAEALRERGVPFLFVTGYGSSLGVPPSLETVPVLTKPLDDGTLSAALEKILT